MTREHRTFPGRSCWADLDGPVHYVDHGGPADAEVLVCVHGLGGSHANWSALAPQLTDRFRVLALDLAGFGLTPGGSRGPTVTANRLLLQRFLTDVVGGPAILVGNSMGGMISALQADAAPQTVRGLVLIDPVLPPVASLPDPRLSADVAASALPGPARRAVLARRTAGDSTHAAVRGLHLCCEDPTRIPPEVLQEHLALARRRPSVPDPQAAVLLAARSLARVLARPRRYAARLHTLAGPVLLIHGDRDRLVPVRAARRVAAANPRWRLEVATGVGHMPMLEAPGWTAGRMRAWWNVESRNVDRVQGTVSPCSAGLFTASMISASTRSASSTGT